MNRVEYANFLLKGVKHTKEEYENMYPKRNIEKNKIVTRFAPSPTGFVHIGSLYSSFVASKFAYQTDGICFLRVEDTDSKRTCESIENIVNDLNNFGIKFNEGKISDEKELGNYGPYVQSNRKDIYQAFAIYLIEKDLAYPCFCSSLDLEKIRQNQEEIKDRIGYYGKYAKCRNLSMDEVIKKVNNGEKYIIRLKSPGDFNNKIVVNDLVKGRLEFPENDIDLVIIKSDGLPTYHFAHLVDDHLMHTTHVIRSDEWVSSLPIHIQLYDVFGYDRLNYCHLSPILKKDNGTIRKISKRKDPEAAVSYYHEEGIPEYAVNLYLMTIANSNFESWLDQNPNAKIEDFNLTFDKVSTSGSLFDMDKLLNISKNYISRLSANEVYDLSIKYCKEYDLELYNLLIKYKNYSINILNIEREQLKPRKDIAKFKDVKNSIWYMYDELFNVNIYNWAKINDINEIKNILNTYMNKYYDVKDKETWFNNIKLLCDELGYASNMKEYKNNPDKFKGNVADVSTVIRVALTSLSQTPDLYEIEKLLGKERILNRINKIN